MRAAVLALPLLLLAAAPAAADRLGPALDLGLGGASYGRSVSTGGGLFARAGLGLQYGRVAVLLHGEYGTMSPPDETLDSTSLDFKGKGGALRVELAHHRGLFIHATAGYSWRHLEGDDDVRRGCSVFGGCEAGFYRETPSYDSGSPWVALAIGGRSRDRIWPGFGLEVGASTMTIDRSGTAPDDRGVMLWLGLNVTLGSD